MRRGRFNPWTTAPARGRDDLSTGNDLQTLKANSETTPALSIGPGVHKKQFSVAVAMPEAGREARAHGNVATSRTALERPARRLDNAHGAGLAGLPSSVANRRLLPCNNHRIPMAPTASSSPSLR